ncbi:MAG: hypothetical protein AAF828_12670 [Bacteroidota bacterium]
MDYIKYLPDTDYDKLPPSVRAEISKEHYQERQRLSQVMGGDKPSLPPVLSTAFRDKITRLEPITATPKVKRRFLPWAAAAGWLLFVLTAALYAPHAFTEQGMFAGYQEEVREEPKVVYELVSAPVLPPRIERDTIIERVVETIVQTKWDTLKVIERIEIPQPTYVYLRDTLYLPLRGLLTSDSVVKSQSAAKNLRLLELLVDTD